MLRFKPHVDTEKILHYRSGLKMKSQSKLSKMQWDILSMAKQSPITNGDILQHCYGFPENHDTRGTRFDRQQIGMEKYLSATSAVSRALARLRDRGLMRRGQRKHELTDAGWRLISGINITEP